MEAARFERNVRTESSEIFTIYGGARRVGRVDIHYGRFEVHGTLLLEVDLTDDELRQIIDQIDEELVQTHDPEREDFLVTVFKAEELGFYSDEYEGDDEAGEDDFENLTEGGLGIAIIRAIADEFELGPGPAGRGSRLRFVKVFSS